MAIEVSKGFFTETDASMVNNPVTNGTVVLQTTDSNGRVAGGLYLYAGAGQWTVIFEPA